MTQIKTQQIIEETVNEAHIKWLSKAETAKIDGVEMTVLPYGYLGQAINEALQSQHQSYIEEFKRLCEGMKMDRETGDGYSAGYDQACSDLIESVDNLDLTKPNAGYIL
jgi:hypothetical protein